MNRWATFFVILGVLLPAHLGCNAHVKQVSGKLAMVGHSPSTYLSIRGENHAEYRVVGSLEEQLAKEYQGRIITLKGAITKEAIGPGFPAEFTAKEIVNQTD